MKTILKTLKYLFLFLIFILVIFTILGHTDFGNFKQADSDYQFISVANEELRFVQKGNGPDILLIHGTPGSIEDWEPLLDELALNYRVTAYDRPGFGYSTANNCDYTIHQNVDIVGALVKKLDLKNPFFIGHSYGGSILANMMATRKIPQQSKIMIIDSPLFGHDVDPTLKLNTVPLLGKGSAVLSRFTLGPKLVENGLRKLFVSIKGKEADAFVDQRLKMWLQPKVIYATSNERNNYDRDLKSVSDEYQHIDSSIPVTILTGSSNESARPDEGAKLKAVIPFANLKKFENCGHYVQFERQNEVLDIIRAMSKTSNELKAESAIH